MFDFSHIMSTVVSVTTLSVVLSGIGTVIAFRQRGGGSFYDWLKYVLPKEIVMRRSCRQDVLFILVKQLIRPFSGPVLMLLASSSCAVATYGLLVSGFGPRPQLPMSVALFTILLIAGVLIQDFLRFYSHVLLHQFSALWDIHKVHHSADFLTPLTNHRSHIIEEVAQQAMTGLSVGPLLALAAYTTQTSISTNSLMGFDAYVLIDALCFSQLRHSHIGLSFYRFERYFLSPKQHQIHHSLDPRHWDRNFGFMLALWDRMAGTIVYSDPRENLTFGVTPAEARDYDNVLKLHFMPYLKIFRRLLPRFNAPEDRPQLKPATLRAEANVPRTWTARS